jgi:hypothetical protein
VIEVIDCATQTETAILIGPIAAAESSPHPAMIEIDGIGMTTGSGCTDEEVIQEEALMTCLTVMRNLVEAGGEGLTVISKVPVAEETQRFVAPLNIKSHFKQLPKQLISTPCEVDLLSSDSTYLLARSSSCMQGAEEAVVSLASCAVP